MSFQVKEVVEPRQPQPDHDIRSGYCARTGTYRSLHPLAPNQHIPSDPDLDVADFVLSHFPHPDLAHAKTALVDSVTGCRVPYSQLLRYVKSLSASLHHRLGVGKGDVVLVLSPNSILYPVITLAVLATGGVLTTANPQNTAAEVAKQLADSGATLVISSQEEAHKVTSTSSVPVLLTTRPSGGSGSTTATLSVEELIEGGDPAAAPACQSTQSDPAAILYSSGTTGVSKGVVLTHRNLISTITLLRWTVDATSSHGEVYIAFIPLCHVYGLSFFALGLLSTEATIVVMPRFDLQAMLAAAERHSVNNILLVPPVILAMVKGAADGQHDLSRLRRVGSGAAPMGKAVARAFRRRYPWVEVRDWYGLTEIGGAGTFFVSPDDARRKEGAVGRLLPEYEGRVVEESEGKAVGPRMVGELWLRGPGVMRGYLGNEEATREAIVEEEGGARWLRTGDLCYFDEEGFLYIVERLKELIKYKGFQVAPAELEAILLGHPQITDAAVIPVEDEESGQIPMAYIVRSNKSDLMEEAVIKFVASKVAPYKKVRKVAFTNSIPRSAAGKILRKQLVAQNRSCSSPSL